jgi:hypothetical protein
MSALTDLQSLEKEIAILKKVLKNLNNPTTELTSVASTRIYNAIIKSNNIVDHFAPKQSSSTTQQQGSGGATNSNAPTRTTTQPAHAGEGDSCCVIA